VHRPIDADDDLLTQPVDASELKRRIENADSFYAVVEAPETEIEQLTNSEIEGDEVPFFLITAGRRR